MNVDGRLRQLIRVSGEHIVDDVPLYRDVSDSTTANTDAPSAIVDDVSLNEDVG